MKPIDSSLLATMAPGPTPSSGKPAEAAEKVFARLLVKEVQRSLPNGSLLGGSDFAPLEAIVTDALADQLSASGLGLDRLFAEGTPTSDPHLPTRAPVPLVHAGRISSAFGMRMHPILGKHQHHAGIDIAAPRGAPIHAAREGVVRVAERRGNYGNLVVVDHGNGLETRYAHCDTLDVTPGQRVRAGDQLATVGDTGLATGPHLHFEVRRHGHAIDPEPWAVTGTSAFTAGAKGTAPPSDTLTEDPGS